MKRHARKRKRTARPVNGTMELAIETVENRTLLTGIVGMAIGGDGSLTLNGDADDNQIEIGLNSADEGYVLGHAGTQIEFNGIVAATHVFSLGDFAIPALDGSLDIVMGQGDDVVTISNAEIDGSINGLSVVGDLTVNMGQGSDAFVYDGGETIPVTIDGFDIEAPSSGIVGATHISGGSGAAGDYVELNGLSVTETLTVLSGAAGNGVDQIVLDDVVGNGLAKLQGGDGQTEIQVNGSLFGDDLRVIGGKHDDQLFVGSTLVSGNTRINSGSSSNGMPGDYIGIGSSRFKGNLQVDGGAGSTTVQFQPTQPGSELSVEGTTTINTRGGSDSILFDSAEHQEFGGDVVLKTGGGSDSVEFESNVVMKNDLTIKLGGGADTLEFANAGVGVSGNGLIQGGGGFDTVIDHVFVTWFSGIPTTSSIEDFMP